jgi:Flp pilus assembly protein TadD
MKHRLPLLSTTSIGVTLVWLTAAAWAVPASAFDVNEGEEATSQPAVKNTAARGWVPVAPGDRKMIVFPKILPPVSGTAPLAFAPVTPQDAVPNSPLPNAPLPRIQFAPLNAPTPVAADVNVPAEPIAPPAIKRIAFPPVSPEVAARAHAQLQATPSVPTTSKPLPPIVLTPPSGYVEPPVAAAVSTAPDEAGYIAALPRFSKAGAAQITSTTAPAPQPQATAAPVVTIPVVKIISATPQPVVPAPAPETAMTPTLTPVAAPSGATPPAPVVPSTPAAPAIVPPAAHSEALSRNTKSILATIPSKLDTPLPGKAQKLNMSRTTPTLDALDIKHGKKDAYEAAGIKISVSRPGLDTNYELNRAFTAISGGDSATAMQIYKNILSAEPTNPDALFGLASIYHRQGQLDKARPLYGVLLKNYPSHREGINNFLVLVSDESPQEALAELERLEQRNPDFSPIPAQQALVLERLGYAEEAQAKMARAIELSPDNLTYKYNLAIMLDRQKNYEQASALYRLLIDAASKGAVIPASVDSLQKRLNYIANVSGAPVPVIN